MPIKERDIVLQGRDGGEDTIDFPVTRLGNVESGAEVKQEPQEGDYIPVIDSTDNEQMKKFPAGWLMEAMGGSGEGGGAGAAAGTGELDLELSRIGGKPLVPYTEETPLTEDGADVELTVDVASGALSQDEEGNWFVNGVELWVKADENGIRRGVIEIQEVDKRWPVRTADEEEPQGCRVPVTLTEGSVQTTLITTGKSLAVPCRSGVWSVTAALEDGTVKKKYAIRVRCVGGDCRVDKVTFTLSSLVAELQYEADGKTPQTLSLAQAEERYGRMADLAAQYDPCRSYGMTEQEKSCYYDNRDPDTGRPIRRKVYRVYCPPQTLHAKNAPAAIIAKWKPGSGSSPYGGKLPVTSIYKGENSVSNPRLPHTASTNFIMPGKDGDLCSSADPMVYPLMGNFVVEGTEDWDKVCGRVYLQVDAGGEEVEYVVLEVYNCNLAGNRQLGRVELDERGLPQKDPEARPRRFEVGHHTEEDRRVYDYADFLLEGADVLLKKMGGPVDREKERFALWAYEEGAVFRGDIPPNAYAVGEWSEEPVFPPDDADAERPVPAKLRLWVSAEAEQVYVNARTDDPEAWLAGNREKRGFRDYRPGKEGFCTAITKTVDGHTRYEYRGGMAAALDPEAGAGELAGTVYLHVKSHGESASNLNETNCGRMYEVELFRGWPERRLMKAEVMDEDGTSVLSSALPETVEGEERIALAVSGEKAWIRLTCVEPSGAGEIPKEGRPRIYLFRKDVEGSFSTDMSQAIRSCPEKETGGADREALGWDQSGVCWARLAASADGMEYRVVVADATGLQDGRARAYTLTLTKAQEESNAAQ